MLGRVWPHRGEPARPMRAPLPRFIAKRAIRFDGVRGYLRAVGSPVSDYPCTLACWVFLHSAPSGTLQLFSLCNPATSDQAVSLRITNSLAVRLAVNATNTALTTNVMQVGQWNLAVGIAQSTTFRRAVCNGDWASSNTTTTSTNFPSNLEVNINYRNLIGANDLRINGIIALPMIFPFALSQSQVTSLWNGTDPRAIGSGPTFMATDLYPVPRDLYGRRMLRYGGTPATQFPPVTLV